MEFDAFDWTEIAGRRVAIIRVQSAYKISNLLNYEVRIDGEKFKIIEVKRYADLGDEIEEVGLTVEPII